MRHARWLATLAMLAGCGSSAESPVDAGNACLGVASDNYCTATHPCCAGAFCDSVTALCRANGACGREAEFCDANTPCCDSFDCTTGRCTLVDTSTAGSGSGTGTSGTTGTCAGPAQPCSVNTDCCSGDCASGNQLCAAGGNTSSSATNGTSSTTSSTTGGTCLSAGAGCSASTDCCSTHCNSGICG